MKEAANCEKFKAYLQEKVEAVNATLARVQTIKKFVIIPEEFTPESGELTPTMKLKRRIINEKYAKEIESMYQ
jgi:long-subunit acyl-CoA synthetase (AMP-forming)